MTPPPEHRFVLPSPGADANLLSEALAAAPDEPVSVQLAGGGPMVLSPELRRALQIIVDALAEGRAVSINPHDTVLTLGQAADLLGVSRSTVRAMADNGELVTHAEGALDLVGLPDLLAAQGRLRSSRRMLRPLAAEAS